MPRRKVNTFIRQCILAAIVLEGPMSRQDAYLSSEELCGLNYFNHDSSHHMKPLIDLGLVRHIKRGLYAATGNGVYLTYTVPDRIEFKFVWNILCNLKHQPSRTELTDIIKSVTSGSHRRRILK